MTHHIYESERELWIQVMVSPIIAQIYPAPWQIWIHVARNNDRTCEPLFLLKKKKKKRFYSWMFSFYTGIPRTYISHTYGGLHPNWTFSFYTGIPRTHKSHIYGGLNPNLFLIKRSTSNLQHNLSLTFMVGWIQICSWLREVLVIYNIICQWPLGQLVLFLCFQQKRLEFKLLVLVLFLIHSLPNLPLTMYQKIKSYHLLYTLFLVYEHIVLGATYKLQPI